VISPKTVANHAEHIYAKINASTRAAAGPFAMQHVWGDAPIDVKRLGRASLRLFA